LDVPIAPLTPVPQSARFLQIYNEFCIDDPNLCDSVWKSEGMIEMLKGFVYFHYIRDYQYLTTSVGTKVNNNEVTRETNSFEMLAEVSQRFNSSQKTYWSIRQYIIDNENATYPEFNGRKIEALGFHGAI